MTSRRRAVEVDPYGHLVPGGNKAAVDRPDDAPAAPSVTSTVAAELGARQACGITSGAEGSRTPDL